MPLWGKKKRPESAPDALRSQMLGASSSRIRVNRAAKNRQNSRNLKRVNSVLDLNSLPKCSVPDDPARQAKIDIRQSALARGMPWIKGPKPP
jgi:hypothetical protein